MSWTVADFLASEHPTAFSFEILPPIRGKSIDATFKGVERLMEFSPAYVNITTHRVEKSYRHVGGEHTGSRRRRGVPALWLSGKA